jgi:DNA-binding NtrC family response regulator
MPHLLIADDERPVRDLLGLALSAAGHQVTAVESGESALAALCADGAEFHAAVLDGMMGPVTGPQVYAALRSRGNRLPVLFVSGSLTPDTTPGLGTDPAVALLPKPFGLCQLTGAVSVLLGTTA